MPTILLALRLLSAPLFIDQCDAGVCSVAFAGDDEADYFTVPQSALPACADETVSVYLGEQRCTRFVAVDCTRGYQKEVK